MGAKVGNQNARKKGKKRVDVHISIADERRAKVERYLKSLGEEEIDDQAIIDIARQTLYDWIDTLNEIC